MEANFANSLENIIAVLNKLTKSTGDYYYLYDFRKQLIYFSDNVESADDIFAVKKLSVPLQIGAVKYIPAIFTVCKKLWMIS